MPEANPPQIVDDFMDHVGISTGAILLSETDIDPHLNEIFNTMDQNVFALMYFYEAKSKLASLEALTDDERSMWEYIEQQGLLYLDHYKNTVRNAAAINKSVTQRALLRRIANPDAP